MKFITWVVFIASIVIFSSVYVSPEYFQYLGLLPFFIPIILIVNIIMFGILTLSWRKLAFIPLLTMLIGYRFFLVTLQIRSNNVPVEGLRVMSYNAHLFDYKKRIGGKFDPNVFNWLKDQNADVKVFQEFYQDYTSASRNAVKLLGADEGFNVFYQPIEGNPTKRSYGMAIFSKYPIINEGKVFDNSHTNGVIFADIKVNEDTIRIYNAHLESMKINSEGLEDIDGIKENYRQTLGKLHRGSLARNKQLKVLVDHYTNSPHPIILMGDFNEIPYSYTYFKLSESLQNAFEVAGSGFGFTYNRIIFFLRIDHIFSSPELIPIQFKTHREVDYSDHYPVSAVFTWEGLEL